MKYKTHMLLTTVCPSRIFLSILAASASGAVYAQSPTDQEVMTITVTGEAKSQRDTTSTVHAIPQKELERVKPAHPAEILNRQAGVHVNNMGGEGHMTAIRQPISTDAAYLFLEDGLPTRPSGLFNHNALYEVNMPQASRIEVIKGPGSALYGSESIGGIINTITAASPEQFELKLNPEVGSYGWKRTLISVGDQLSQDIGARLNLNITDNSGYRDEADYFRVSSTLRLDGQLSEKTKSKTILAVSKIDQSGVDSLEFDRYQQQSTYNRFHGEVGRREVEALRLSNEFTTDLDSNSRVTVTPYFRDNRMDLMPSWMLTYDPNDRVSEFQSYGVLAKFREKISETIEWIAGVDVDYTPSSYREIRLAPNIQDGIYTSANPTGRVNYDFEADQLAIAPYIHTEWQTSKQLRLTAGLRYDFFDLDYQDNLDDSVVESQTGADRFTHLRPDSQTLSFEHLSPKLGAVYHLNDAQSLYASYRHSFRAPAIGTLFRSGSSTNTDELDPVQTDSFEVGVRGSWSRLNYDLAVYHMIIKDDVVTFIDEASADRKVTNAGKTQHQGIELTLGKRFDPEWSGQLALSYSNQSYDDFIALVGFPATEINYADNDVPRAPKTIASISVRYEPLALLGSAFEFEMNHLGEYFTDEANSQSYGGHTVGSLLATYPLNSQFELYGRITNIADRVYSTYTSNQVGDPDLSYQPGNPRSFFVGFNYQL